ncbi:MAG: M20 family metallo-hydrolase [Bacillota bacterium]
MNAEQEHDQFFINNCLSELAKIGETPEGGVTRLAFTVEDVLARNKIMEWMELVGLKVRLDAAGNIFGRYTPDNSDGEVVMIGSHIDTVINGGLYDGALGVVVGLCAIRRIIRSSPKMKRSIELVIFSDEEGVRFGGGLFGSKALIKDIALESITNFTDEKGISLFEALKNVGGDAEQIPHLNLNGDVKCYLEAHIDQSNELNDEEKPIGIVTAIAGPVSLSMKILGRAGHAGAEPMDQRKDALAGAAEIILAVEETVKAVKCNYLVGTVGNMKLYPGASNVIPGEVELTIDIRGIDAKIREEALKKIIEKAKQICTARGLILDIFEKHRVDPISLDEELISLLEDTSDELGIPYKKIISRASHDAMNMAKVVPTCMLLVRNMTGSSHCPEEEASIEDILKTVDLTAAVLQKIIFSEK